MISGVLTEESMRDARASTRRHARQYDETPEKHTPGAWACEPHQSGQIAVIILTKGRQRSMLVAREHKAA